MYEEYMQNFLGYPPRNVYGCNTYNQYQERTNMPNVYNPIFNRRYTGESFENTNMEEWYPDIYNIINPMVKKAIDKNTKQITEKVVDEIVEEIYNNLQTNDGIQININLNNEVRNTENDEVIKESEDRNINNRRNILSDLIKILVIKELYQRIRIK